MVKLVFIEAINISSRWQASVSNKQCGSAFLFGAVVPAGKAVGVERGKLDAEATRLPTEMVKEGEDLM